MSFRIGAVLTIFSTVIIGGLFAGGLVSSPRHERWLKSAAAVVGLAAIVISAVALSGNLEPVVNSDTEPVSARFTGSSLPFQVGARPPSIEIIAGNTMLTGHARLEPARSAQVSGLMFLTYLKADNIIGEAVIPAISSATAGLFPFRLDDKYKTAVAISNPNDSTVNVTFSTMTGGQQTGFGIPANGQITAFLDEPPFNIHEPRGTFKFEAATPVAIVALLTLQDPFLMARIPMAIPGSAHNEPVHIPYVINGSGWSVELVLLNPTSTLLTGHHRWYTASGALTEDVTYSIPAETSVVYKAKSPPSGARPGRVEVLPGAGQPSPAATAMLFLEKKQQSSLVSVSGVKAGLDAFLYAAAPGVRSTEVAIANPSAETVRVKVGSELSVPARGLAVVTVPAPGIVNVSAGSPVAVTVLRNLIAHDNHRLISSYPADLPIGRFFPHFASGGGFESTFVLIRQSQTTALGQLQFFGPGGSPLQLSMFPK
jgi:hypothetical protein